jgi:CheY-like chemotaxis protein
MTGRDKHRGAEQDAGGLAGAVHDATNSLTVLLGWLERAADDDADDAHHALSRAREHALLARRQMRKAIGARASDAPDGAAAAEATAAQAARILTSICDDLAREAEQAGVKLQPAITPATGELPVALPAALGRVLTNLLLNAIAASPRGSAVSMRLTNDDGGMVRFEIHDAGPGIPADRREALFSSGVTTRDGGAGIGLRQASRVTQDAGGTLALIDQDVHGACFALCWPCAAPSPTTTTTTTTATAAAAAAPTKARLDGLHMLMLEDDVAIQELLELSLPARGASLQTVESLETMRSALSARDFDVLLMDLSPLGDQLDAVLDELRAEHPTMSLIVTSGSVTAWMRDDIRWLRKPFTPDELASAIRRERPSEE